MNLRDAARRRELALIAELHCLEERLCRRNGRVERIGPPDPRCLHAVLRDDAALARLLRWGDDGHRAWAKLLHRTGSTEDVLAVIRALSAPAPPERDTNGDAGVA